MKRTKSSLLALLTALALAVSMTAPALAASSTDHITITKPKNSATYYIGETIPIAATLKKYEVGNYSEVSSYSLSIGKKGSNKALWSKTLVDNKDVAGDDVNEDPTLFPNGKPYKYSKKVKTGKFAAGKYTLKVTFMGYLTHTSEENAIEDGRDDLIQTVMETASVNITLKKLKAPSGLKAKAGKKKVTVSYKKATGAKKYEIYRSTKKKSGYKKIATTTKVKFTDKKVKAGKKYYYKVKSVRGSVKSGYSSYKRSGKVQKAQAAKKASSSTGTVYYTPSGKCYHRKTCATLKRSRTIYKTTVSKAKAKKLRACKVCKP